MLEKKIIAFFQKKHPEVKTFSDVMDVIKAFSLRRFLYQKHYEAVCRTGNSFRIEKWKEKIEKLDEVGDNILTKYIAKELFLYFLVSFLFFFVIFFVNQILLLAETILRKRVPVWSVVRLIWYCLPAIVAQSAPFATLVGFLMSLGRMVTDNEVMILRASGQRYSRILLPVVIMGMAISLFSFLMNDYFLPLGTIKYNQLYKEIIVSNPAMELESNSIKKMNDSTVIIGEVDKNHVSDLVIFDSSSKDEQRIIVAKDSDIFNAVSPGVMMQLNMDDSVIFNLNKKDKSSFDTITAGTTTLNIFESSIITSSGGVSPREMTSFDLFRQIQKMAKNTSTTKKQLNTYKLEYNKKFSIPFGSIFFALLAFPLALIFGKKDGQTLGLIFGIIISVLYWAATILGQMFGLRSGYNGFVMMWTPNLLIGLIGIYLYLRLRRK